MRWNECRKRDTKIHNTFDLFFNFKYMLETLDKEQISHMKVVSDRFIDNFNSWKRFEKEKIIKWVEMIYEISNLTKPEVVFVNSPLSAQQYINSMKNVEKNVWTSIMDSMTGIVNKMVFNIWDTVKDNVTDDVDKCVGKKVRDGVWFELARGIIGGYVEIEIRKNTETTFHKFWYYWDIYDYWWISYYTYFQEIWIHLWEVQEKFNIYRDMMLGWMFNMIQLDWLCVVSELPLFCRKDSDHKLHCTTWPAIEWEDGYKLYFINWNHIEENEFKQEFLIGIN